MEEAMSSTEQSAQNELVGGLAISQLVGEEDHDHLGGAEETGLKRRLWVETKKLWHLVGPTILSRICSATFAVVTQAFAGHLGDVELPSPSSTPLFLASVSDSCMNVNAWEMMIPISFFAAIGVRVANELGAGNGKGAKFATKVSVGQSLLIGIVFSLLIILFHHKLAMIFSSSHDVIQAVGKLSYLLALTILFNSVQPVLSGYLGWYDFWDRCANNNIGRHNNIVRLGERGTKSCTTGEAFVES
ncbi:hypothetical protein RHGRI_016608 [Rhododendron griersonianum]|uniref:Uncharacterized protein n=2 Tax=Rhododendron griersonianum TaxID=479676 RepID=A0AAV6JUS7_9ERIC|nr:hypothetical protein RHGRI_016608 [Rhododendron griersonianum]